MPSPSTLLPIIFPFVFIGMWILVCIIISKAGWSRLAQRHTAFAPPVGTKYSFESGNFSKLANYNRCLTFHLGRPGLRMSVIPIFAAGHPALLFPWSEVRYQKEAKTFFVKRYLYDLGTPRAGRIWVSAKIHAAIQSHLN